MRLPALLFALLVAAPAQALPLQLKNAESVRVQVNRQSKPAFALRPDKDREGWRLAFVDGANGSAELVDVTPGTPARTLAVPINGGELFLDGGRFAGGHVYHLVLRRSGAFVGSSYVYLYPVAPLKEGPRRGPQRVQFVADEPANPSSDEIQPVSKSGL
jgi:hypothetical protein